MNRTLFPSLLRTCVSFVFLVLVSFSLNGLSFGFRLGEATLLGTLLGAISVLSLWLASRQPGVIAVLAGVLGGVQLVSVQAFSTPAPFRALLNFDFLLGIIKLPELGVLLLPLLPSLLAIVLTSGALYLTLRLGFGPFERLHTLFRALLLLLVSANVGTIWMHADPAYPLDRCRKLGVLSCSLVPEPVSSRPDLHQVRRALPLSLGGELASVLDKPMREPLVVIFAWESLLAPSSLVQGALASDPTPTLTESLWACGGELEVPTFGGASPRTHFEVLTGVPYSAFQPGFEPSLSLTRPIHSIARNALPLSIALDTVSPEVWAGRRFYQNLGFAEARFSDSFATSVRGIRSVSDLSLVQETVSAVNAVRPGLVWLANMESHAPYNLNFSPASRAPYLSEAQKMRLGFPAHAELEAYFYALSRGDLALKELRAFLLEASRSRDVVLVVFGDHAPRFQNRIMEPSWRSVYAVSRFRDGAEVAPKQRCPRKLGAYRLLASVPEVPDDWKTPAMVLKGSSIETLSLDEQAEYLTQTWERSLRADSNAILTPSQSAKRIRVDSE